MTVTSTPRRSCLRSRWAVGSLVVGLLIAACSAAEQPQNSTPAEHVDLTAALPASACGDDQPGRYLAEIFALPPVVTRQFAGGCSPISTSRPTIRPAAASASYGSTAEDSLSSTAPGRRSRRGARRSRCAAI